MTCAHLCRQSDNQGDPDMVMNYDPKTPVDPEPQPIKCRRIDIPLDPFDSFLVREVADILSGAASRMEFWSRMTDRDDREKRIMIADIIDGMNSEIRKRGEIRGYYWRQGRPKAGEVMRSGGAEPETAEIDPAQDLPRLVK